ncbi:hypothetical protein AK812_SmicGene46652 [Symbiodinium microadriaticum]|uniref:Uncharacterized protein n=1 Tax=Symbiodinium microadriaticum TaxID=2951 RepID=A0A1Q9BTH0_SYMMI|nr:hypothetical protein AK812_SmicGene46652 [Symbiodinium microadriaticum]CAE7864283.1 unnamed protein product [Symbiodinium sp. KB8]
MLKLPQRDLAYKSFDAWGLLVQAYNEKLLEAAHNMLAVHTSLGSALGTGSPLRAAWHVAYHDVLEVLGAAFRAWAVVSTASTRPAGELMNLSPGATVSGVLVRLVHQPPSWSEISPLSAGDVVVRYLHAASNKRPPWPWLGSARFEATVVDPFLAGMTRIPSSREVAAELPEALQELRTKRPPPINDALPNQGGEDLMLARPAKDPRRHSAGP